jgi:hypothetical protein
MEPSRGKQWQTGANRPYAKAAETAQIRCRALPSVAAGVKW